MNPSTLKFLSISTCTVVICLVMATSCKQSDDHPAGEHEELRVSGDTVAITTAQRNRIRLATSVVTQNTISTDLVVNGRIEVPPQDAARLGAPLGGVVRSISVLQGSPVRRGQTIFTLEHADFITLQRDYLTTVSKLQVLESELQRQQALADEQINAGKVLEQISGDVRTLRIQRKAQQEQLALLQIDANKLTVENISRTIRITSPIDGFVTGVYAVTGEYLTPNDSLADIISLRHLHAEFFVFERDITALTEGQTFSAMLNDALKTPITGTVHLVGRGVESDRTIRVHGHLDHTTPTIIPGTTLTATIAANPRSAILVPSNAVINDADGSWIFLEDGENQYVRIKVVRGVNHNSKTEIRDVPENIIGRHVVVRGVSMLSGAFSGGGDHAH